jgi:anti-sigma-K factor RskA
MTAPMVVAGLAAGDRMGVTVEPAGGSSAPSSPPVLMLSLPAD